MFKLIYKELRLSAHPTLYIFMLLGSMVIIPSYPYGVVFLYGCLAPFITLFYGRENNDTFYTALLPVKKRDVVKGKCLLFVIAELGQLVISIPFAVLRSYILPEGNPVGMEANVAYYGFGLMIFSLFNFVFLTEFYKTAYQVGRAFLLAVIPVILGIVVMEMLPHIHAVSWVDSMNPDAMLRQMPILIMGIVLYIAGMIFTYHLAAKRFERVDL